MRLGFKDWTAEIRRDPKSGEEILEIEGILSDGDPFRSEIWRGDDTDEDWAELCQRWKAKPAKGVAAQAFQEWLDTAVKNRV